jgi:glutamyl-tRNA synthetase
MTVTRFAPSPTGYLHIGGLRTALFNWLWARKSGGKFLLRIEDTDLSRNSQDAIKAILEVFDWVGLDYDGEAEYQSKRYDIYKKYIEQLLSEGKAYKCYMTKDELKNLKESQIANGERPRYDGRYRDFKGTPPEGVKPVIRIKAPFEGEIVFNDGVKGQIEISADEVDDFIIARADGTPTYNFVVTVDDALMRVTDVIRGDDHLYNTPKQLIVYRALGFKVPKFYHIPMIHNENGKKLSKRDGALNVMEYKRDGFLPEALLNFLVRLGWSYKDQEIFSIDEMINLFYPKDINRGASNYNLDKLIWLNGHYINNTTNERLAHLLLEFGIDIKEHDKMEFLLDATKIRSKTLVELRDNINLIINPPESYDPKALKRAFRGDNREILREFSKKLSSEEELHLPSDYHRVMEEFVTKREVGFGKIGQPLRVALLGKMIGPGLDEVMAILGIEESVSRIERVLSVIE